MLCLLSDLLWGYKLKSVAAPKSFKAGQVLLALIDAKCDNFTKDQLLPVKQLNTGKQAGLGRTRQIQTGPG